MSVAFNTTDIPISYYEDVYASLPELITLIYLGIFIVAFFILAIYAHYKLSSDNFSINCSFGNWCSLMFDLHKIYLHAVIHTADTVSDMAVIAQFYRLAYREYTDESFNVEGLDMMGLLIGTIVALLTYRLYTAYHLFYIAGGSILLFTLQFLDFGVYLSIYLAWKLNRTEPIFWQDYLTHVEALFESIPQILIQSQFVLRSGHNYVVTSAEELIDIETDTFVDIEFDNSIVVASIVIAFVSVVTRFVKSDFPFIHKEARSLILTDDEHHAIAPYISWKCIALYLFRTCEIVTRLVCGVFIWAVLGVWPLIIIFAVGLTISSRILWKTRSQRFLFWYITIPIECVITEKHKHIWIRCIENWIYLSVITFFSYAVNIDCFTCASVEMRQIQLDPNGVVWSLGYLYLFLGWICSILLPLCWIFIVPTLYNGREKTPESRREEIMALPRMFYRKRGCYKATVTPLHFAIHRKFYKQMKDIIRNDEVEIDEIRISGATALHSAVGRSLKDVVEILLRYGADPAVVKKQVWYFVVFIPCKWCGYRNWYEGKTALEIAQFKIDKEIEDTGVEALGDDHVYMQVLELLKKPPQRIVDDIGRTLNVGDSNSDGLDAEVELIQKDTQIVGNSEDALMDDMVAMHMDADAEIRHVQQEIQRTSVI